MGLKKNILQDIEEQQLRWYSHPCEWRIAKLQDWLQNGTHSGRGGSADQSIHRRMRLGTVCKEETLRMKSASIMSSGGRKLCLWVEENCVPTEKFLYIYIRQGV
jgi:hypothetical protein